MITDVKHPETTQELPKFYSKNAQAANLVLNHGVDPKTALTLASGKPPCDTSLKVFKRKVAEYALTAPAMVKLAHKAVTETLRMKGIKYETEKAVPGVGVVPITETIMPTISNRLAAAAMVLDRDQPVIHKSVNLTGQVSISPVDLLEYMGSENKQ